MADDQSFRPEKREINPSEVESAASQEKNQAAMEAAQQIRSQASGEETGPLPGDPGFQPGEGGPSISGPVPPAFRQALQQKKAEGASDAAVGNPRPKQRQQQLTNQPDMRVVGSKLLEDLIAGIQENTSIFEEVELPSKGRFYNGDDGPTDGKIHLRPMTGEEEQILATPRFVKRGDAIDMIFRSCMQERFDTSDFLTADRTYLLIFLRGISYSPEYDVEVRDPDTDQKFATTINLNDLWVESCPAEFSEDNLVDTLPTSGYKFKYRLSRGRDEKELTEYRERRAKGFDTAGQADDTLLYRTAQLIDNIEGLEEKDEIQLLLKKLPISDVSYLRNVVNDPPFGVDTTVEITSPFTLQDFEIELPLEANFFFPRSRKKAGTQA